MATIDAEISAIALNRFVQGCALLLAAIVLSWIVGLLFEKGFARLARRTRTDVDDRLIEILRSPIRWSVVLLGATLGVLRIDPSSLVEIGKIDLTGLTLNTLATIAIVLWMVAGIRSSNLLLNAASGRLALLDASTLPLFRNLANVVIAAAAVYFVFVTWGINLTGWFASAGIVGIAFGFAAKDTLANLFAGIFILADAPYRVGDWVVLGTGERGQVTHVGIRSTRLLTRDDVEITIPNAVIGGAKIVNESRGRWTKMRVAVRVGVAYGSDIDQVRRVLEEVARENPDVCDDPEPRVRLRAFGESGLDIDLLGWINDPVDRGRVSDDLHTAVYKRFAAERIEIPYPKRDLYVKQLPPGPGGGAG